MRLVRSLMLVSLLLALAAPATSSASGLQNSPCFGAGVFESRCIDSQAATRLSLNVFPSIAVARKTDWRYGSQRNAQYCRGGLRWRSTLLSCSLGVDEKHAEKTLALIGDSHSAAWRPAIDAAAKARHWNVISLVESGCDYTLVTQDRGGFVDPAECRRWRLRIPSFLAARRSIHTIILTQYSYEGRGESPAHEIAAYRAAWKKLPASVEQLVVIRDNPRGGVEYYKCIENAQSKHAALGRACASPRAEVLPADYSALAAASVVGRKARVIDLTDRYCNLTVCFPVIGGALVYGENSHFTPTFNRTLAPAFLAELDKGGPIN